MIINKEIINLVNGQEIKKITLQNTGGMEVEILTLGGIIKGIKVPDRDGVLENVVLEFDDINSYIENPGYINALIGRTAGRINLGEFTLNDEMYKVGCNEGNHNLHGGIKGFDKKIWIDKDVSTENKSAVQLTCFSKDGEEGYPGNLEVKVTYSLDNNNILDIIYEAIPDKDTLISLTNHSYFNLSGNGKRLIEGHELEIKGSKICELDKDGIATGNLLDVDTHSVFDFRTSKKIGRDANKDHEQLNIMKGYDHPWVLDSGDKCVILYDEVSGRKLEISTDQEILVAYTMNNKIPLKFTNGKRDIAYYGVTFETQGYPVGYNESFKEHNIIKANEKYVQKTSWKFSCK